MKHNQRTMMHHWITNSILFLLTFFTSTSFAFESKNDALQAVLGEFLLHLESMQSSTEKKLDSMDQRVNESLKKSVAELSSLNVSVCLLRSWLVNYASSGRGVEGLETYLKDLLESQRQSIETTVKELKTRMDETDSKLDGRLNELARLITGNESSLTEIRELVMPKIFERYDRLTEDIPNPERRIEYLGLKYKSEYESLCSRMAALEKKLERLRESLDSQKPNEAPTLSPRGNSENNPLRSVLKAVAPIPDPPAFQEYHPYYITMDKNAVGCVTLLRSNYVYYCKDVDKNGVITNARYEGQIYRTSQGLYALIIGSWKQ